MRYITTDEAKVEAVIENWRDTGICLQELLDELAPIEEESNEDH